MSIITAFNKFEVSEDDANKPAASAEASKKPATEAKPTEATEPKPAENAPAEEKPAEAKPTEEKPKPEPEEEDSKKQVYGFSWYTINPANSKIEPVWYEIKAASDKEAISSFKASPNGKHIKNTVLDSLNGSSPKGSQRLKDGVVKTIGIDSDKETFVTITRTFSGNDPDKMQKGQPSEITFFAAEAEPEQIGPVATTVSAKESREDIPTEPVSHDSPIIDPISQKYEALCKHLEDSGVKCKVTLSEGEIIVELGRNYPDSLADLVFKLAQSEDIHTRELSVCATAVGHKSQDVNMINGGYRDWSMMKYARRDY